MAYLVCDTCGEEFDLNPDETADNFDSECDECGGNLKYREDDSIIDGIYCTSCGHENDSDSIFCENCGKKLSQRAEIKKHSTITSLNWKAIIIGCVVGTILAILFIVLFRFFLGFAAIPFFIGLITGYLVNKDSKNGLIHSGIANFIVAIIFSITLLISAFSGIQIPGLSTGLFGVFVIFMIILFLVLFLIIGSIGGIIGVYIKKFTE